MPERMNEMNDLATMPATVTSMTLKEITDMLDVRHNNAMRTVAEMAEDPAFGGVTQIEYRTSEGNTYQTYQLDKRQSIAVAAHLNVSLLMRIIDRWQELEAKQAVIGNDHYAAKLLQSV
jgi:phage regulator Rha-like protein